MTMRYRVTERTIVGWRAIMTDTPDLAVVTLFIDNMRDRKYSKELRIEWAEVPELDWQPLKTVANESAQG